MELSMHGDDAFRALRVASTSPGMATGINSMRSHVCVDPDTLVTSETSQRLFTNSSTPILGTGHLLWEGGVGDGGGGGGGGLQYSTGGQVKFYPYNKGGQNFF